MKLLNKTTFCTVCILLIFSLCGCTININIGQEQKTSVNSDTKGTEDVIEFVEAEPQTDLSGAVVAPNAKAIRVSKALSIYEKAANAVKSDAVGFKKTQWQDFNDINIGEPTGIADMVLTIVSKNVIKNNNASDARKNAEIIEKGNTAAVTESFPLFGFQSAYIPNDDNHYISGAEYEKKDGYKEYYIYFADALNPTLGEAGFGGIMTPFDRNLVLDGIRNYGWNVKEESMKFDCMFSGCYMIFRIDDDGRLIYLEQNLYATVDAKAEIDLYVASTNFLNGQCRYEEHYTYSEFNY